MFKPVEEIKGLFFTACARCEHTHGKGCEQCPANQGKATLPMNNPYRLPDGRINIGTGDDLVYL